MLKENHYHLFHKTLSESYFMPQKLLDAFYPLLTSRDFHRDEYLLREGRVPEFAWFIVQGYVREIKPTFGQPYGHTTWFWYPGEIVIPPLVFFTQRKATSDLEALKNTVLLEISYSSLLELSSTFREVGALEEEIRFRNEEARLSHAEDLFNLTGKQRYDKLLSTHPNLFNAAKHRDIASFIGIKDIGFRRYFSIF